MLLSYIQYNFSPKMYLVPGSLLHCNKLLLLYEIDASGLAAFVCISSARTFSGWLESKIELCVCVCAECDSAFSLIQLGGVLISDNCHHCLTRLRCSQRETNVQEHKLIYQISVICCRRQLKAYFSLYSYSFYNSSLHIQNSMVQHNT